MIPLNRGCTPLREALRRLADRSLVAHTPSRGVTIDPLDVFDSMECLDAIASLAGTAVPLAAERLTDKDLARPGELVANMAHTSVDVYPPPARPTGLEIEFRRH